MPTKPEKHNPNKPSADNHKREVSGGIFVRGEIEIHQPPGFEKKKNATDERFEIRDKKRFLIEKLTLATVLIYGGLTGWQAYEARTTAIAALEANRQTKEIERTEDAPYVDVLKVSTQAVPDGSELLQFNLKNYGKTPAQDVRAFTRFATAPPGGPAPQFVFDERQAKGSIQFAPDGEYSVHLQYPIGPAIVKQYHMGIGKVYFALSLWYSDVWSKNERQQLVFCEEFNPLASQWEARYPDCKSYKQ